MRSPGDHDIRDGERNACPPVEEAQAFADALAAEFAPRTPYESALVDQIGAYQLEVDHCDRLIRQRIERAGLDLVMGLLATGVMEPYRPPIDPAATKEERFGHLRSLKAKARLLLGNGALSRKKLAETLADSGETLTTLTSKASIIAWPDTRHLERRMAAAEKRQTQLVAGLRRMQQLPVSTTKECGHGHVAAPA